MKEFISLREFLLLVDPVDHEPKRTSHRSDFLPDTHYHMATPRVMQNGKGKDFVMRYDIAKASWEKYGDLGPLVGSTVETLYAGHGGGPGCLRRFDGVFSRDERFFVLSAPSVRPYDDHTRDTSMVDRSQWWAHIHVVKDAT